MRNRPSCQTVLLVLSALVELPVQPPSSDDRDW